MSLEQIRKKIAILKREAIELQQVRESLKEIRLFREMVVDTRFD